MRRRFRARGAFLAPTVFALSLICLFLGFVWLCGRSYARVCFDVTYYFLVRECEDAASASVTAWVYVSGGAGYVLEAEGKTWVALSCYDRQTAAESVQRSMTAKGEETYVLALSFEEFSLSGGAAAWAEQIEANAATVDSCARLLYDTANGLERAELSQTEARAAVRGVVSSLRGLQEGNGAKLFELWNAALRSAERKGTEIAQGIVFAKDLRYLQIQLCLAVLGSKDYFL